MPNTSNSQRKLERPSRGEVIRTRGPGLNPAAGYAGLLSLILLLLAIGCSKKEPARVSASSTQPAAAPTETYPNLATQAKEICEALTRKDFARFADLTYPKAIELLGGRDKMIATTEQQLKEMEGEGVVLLSSTAAAPTQFVHESNTTFAVLPMTLKIKAQDGVFQTESSMIGISSDGGASWTFIDASGKDQSELKSLLPGVADKLNLPPDKKPVKVSDK
jgi:hypothetical protein